MLISPPFLPARPAHQADDAAWVDAAMPGGAPGDGGYPLSFNLGWHGGIHLTAPTDGNQSLRVRAIADGTVVYLRQPEPVNNNPDHAQNYRGGWTDNGCVIIRHVTEIGAAAQGGAPTRVVFFSICMHLDEIHRNVRLNQPIYRKAEIGRGGRIYGNTERKIHFEIICDQTNLQAFVHRVTGDVPTGDDGRSDAVYGEMYFHLPSDVPAYAARPALNLATGTGGTALGEELLVGIRYAGGNAQVTTYRPDGTALGDALAETDAEYNLYANAGAIVGAYRAAQGTVPQAQRAAFNVPAQSAVYELLRFGRVINTANETLTPADTPHWREIRTPNGQGWVNLNASTVHKFSDADFPQWRGWKLIDDDTDGNSQCNSAVVKTWLDTSGDGQVPFEADPVSVTTQEARASLQSDAVQAKLKRSICKFPTEWDASNFAQRYGWLKAKTADNPNPLSASSYDRLKAHVEVLAFWSTANLQVPQFDAQGNQSGQTPLDAVHWHFHPREVIKHFRQCGWLSRREFLRCLPARYQTEERSRGTTVIQVNLATATGSTRVEQRDPIIFFKMCRKYGIDSRLRLAHFLAQVYRETGVLRWTEELASGDDYEGRVDLGNTQTGDGRRFKGRGLIQTTGRANYAAYSTYRGKSGGNSFTIEPNNLLLSTDAYSVADAAGFYWVSRSTGGGAANINRVADRGTAENTLRSVTQNVNGAEDGLWTGLLERRSHFRVLQSVLLDTVMSLNPERERTNV